jgi:hypothetical protein
MSATRSNFITNEVDSEETERKEKIVWGHLLLCYVIIRKQKLSALRMQCTVTLCSSYAACSHRIMQHHAGHTK